MRIMRLLVMFDLPTKTKADKDNYIKFKRFLDDDGYQREQNSVYSRNLLSRASSESHAEQLRKHLPPAGHVVAMELTEKQYVAGKFSSTRLRLTIVTIIAREHNSSWSSKMQWDGRNPVPL